jgi:OTU domain-containing protein 6
VLDTETEARLEKEAKEEERDINRICDELSVQIHEVCEFYLPSTHKLNTYLQINPDGHCLFSAIADQLALLGILPSSQANYAVVRQTASQYIYTHRDDFLPFLPPPPGLDGLMTPELFEGYCVAIRDTAEWGGEPEIRALCRAYRIPIHVIQAGRPPIVVHDPYDPAATNTKDKEKHVIRISYHRRMYGLGEVSQLIPC